jgi:hypothetical protein
MQEMNVDKVLNKLPLGLFFAYTVKMLVMGGTLVDAGLLAVIAGTAALFEFKKDTRIQELEEVIKSQNTRLQKAEGEIGDMRSFLNGTKIANAFSRK